ACVLWIVLNEQDLDRFSWSHAVGWLIEYFVHVRLLGVKNVVHSGLLYEGIISFVSTFGRHQADRRRGLVKIAAASYGPGRQCAEQDRNKLLAETFGRGFPDWGWMIVWGRLAKSSRREVDLSGANVQWLSTTYFGRGNGRRIGRVAHRNPPAADKACV